MKKIKLLREQVGLSQGELAEKLGIGRTTISMWETGESMPRADKLPELAKLFNCSIDNLFNEIAERKIV